MLKRIIVGTFLIVLTAVVLWLDWWLEQAFLPRVPFGTVGDTIVLRALPLAVLMLLLISAGYLELSRLSAGAGLPVLGFSGMVCAIMVGTLPFWRQALAGSPYSGALMQVVLGGVVMILFADQIIRYRTADAVRRMGTSLLAVCYLGVCGAMILEIRMQFGLKAFILFLVVVKATDIGAYFVGTVAGRHKLTARLSPNKSWEGLFGGLAVATGVALGFVAVFNPVFVDWSAGPASPGGGMGLLGAVVFGVVLGLFGQGADLCESAMKRDAGLKDAGASVPAFGGVLDVIDSPLLAAPAGYVLLALLR